MFLKKPSRFSKLSALLLVLIIVCSILPITSSAEGDWTIVNSESWAGGSAASVIDGRTLTITPSANTNDQTSVYYYFQYHFTGTEDLAPGEVEIRLPRHIFYDRAGNPTGVFGIAIPEAPTHGLDGYHYTIDPDTDEIVVTNHDAVAPGTPFMCGVEYFFTPTMVADGFENNFTVHYAINTPEGTVEKTSDPITVKVDTDFPTPAVAKYGPTGSTRESGNAVKYEEWQTAWGDAPADAADYFYIQWYMTLSGSYQSTQPYTVKLAETPGDGEVVAWKQHNASQWTFGNGDALSQTVFLRRPESYTDVNNHSSNVSVLLRYPRSLAVDGQNITNTVTSVAEGYDNGSKTAASSVTYPYKAPTNPDDPPGPTDPTPYPGDSFTYEKGHGGKTRSLLGGRALLNDGQDIGLSWTSLYLSNRCWERTQESTVPCCTVIQDSMLNVLGPNDYEFTRFSINAWNEYTASSTAEGYSQQLNSDKNTYGAIELFVRTRDSADWFKYGDIRYYNRLSYNFIGSQGGWFYQFNKESVPLPEGTLEIQFRHTGTAAQLILDITPTMTLHPTSNVLAYLDTTGNVITNTASFAAADAGTGEFHDIGDYDGAAGGSDWGKYNLGAIVSRQSGKTVSAVANDAAAKQCRVTYTLKGSEICNVTNGFSNEQKIIVAKQALHEQRSAVFYDLLPEGAAIDPASIQTGTVVGNTQTLGTSCDYTIEQINNWRDSGRTMVILRVSVPNNMEYNFNIASQYVYSGLIAKFDAVFDWDQIGETKTKTNTFAYFSPDGPLVSGYADDGGGFTGALSTEKPYYTDLDGDGNPDPNHKNVWYGSANVTMPNITSAETGLVKKVRSDEDSSYAKDAVSKASAGGGYRYRLGYLAPVGSQAKDVVIYDVLENAAETDVYWRGTLKRVDVSNLILTGINPKVYYSTSAALRTDGITEANSDLTDSSVWTLTMPTDPAQITAIAVDMRESLDGGDYVFQPTTGASFNVLMQAPEGITAEQIENELKAYNNAWLHSTMIAPSGPMPSSLAKGSATSIGIRIPQPEIHKISDPKSGIQRLPTYVAPGDPIQYTLTVKNTETASAIRNIIVEDTIPEGLEIDFDNIRCYFNGQSDSAVLVSESSRVGVVRDGQKLTFTIDTLGGSETAHLIIPTASDANQTGTLTCVNTAYITGVSGCEVNIQSETTYHKISQRGVLSFSKAVIQDGSADLSGTAFRVQIRLTNFSEGGRTLQVTQRGTYPRNPRTIAIGFRPTGAQSYPATFYLYEGETIVIEDIPMGTSFNVTELGITTDYPGYLPVYKDELGNAASTGSVNASRMSPHVDITNYYGAGGELAFTKTVAGCGDPEEYFKVNVRLRPVFLIPGTGSVGGLGGPPTTPITITESGSYAGNPQSSVNLDMQSGSSYSFYLKHGETVRLSGIPIGSSYVIEEEDYSGEDYITSYWSESTGNVANSGQLLADDVLVPIYNYKTTGAVSFTKNVSGNFGDRDKYFDFTVTFTNETGEDYSDKAPITVSGGSHADNPDSVDITSGSATVTFKLKHGETVRFDKIPYGMSYSYSESDYSGEGYVTTYPKIGTGVLDENGVEIMTNDTSGVMTFAEKNYTVTNEKNSTVDTGIILDNLPYITALALILLAGAAFFVGKKRRYSADCE